MSGVALITGGQQGIGLAIATELAAAGFKIAIASLPAPDAAPVAASLAALGQDARYYQHDIRDIAAVHGLLARIEADLGPVTTLVNNAGMGAPARGDMLEMAPESFDQVMAVNLRGGFFLTQEVARRMCALPQAPYRAIIFITSVSATMASVERAEYCISKAGASMASTLFALRLAPEGIGVFELRPGIIATEMTAGARDSYTPRIENGLVPARRWGEPEDIGRVVLPLVTGQMPFATGAVIPVDGGLSIARL
ncbi:3-ketoacyl-ACP reductase [Dinoroseobacter sp. S124A]|uniref:3-ketoacyl-ACP reductase n=1 Tax=Dinoroseobacter sp. S124A TaxID=3415128 RepID=UPI003C7ABE22